jgi:type II secretory pathway pseudopilin PulG
MIGRAHRGGFTHLEALVVILIVGILASAAIYGLGLSRAMNRDAKRLSDVSVIRAALTQYWLQSASYPAHQDYIEVGRADGGTHLLTSSGFFGMASAPSSVFLNKVPVGPRANEYYGYRGSARGYSLRFTTERTTVYGQAGTWYAHTNGVDGEDVDK